MTKNRDTLSSKGIIDTGESTESKQIIKNITVFDNLDQNIIKITEDKMRLILIKYDNKIEDKKSWIAPLGIFITLFLIPLTTEKFKNVFFVSASIWQAGCYIAMAIVFVWLIHSIIKIWSGREVTIDSIIDELKQDSAKNR